MTEVLSDGDSRIVSVSSEVAEEPKQKGYPSPFAPFIFVSGYAIERVMKEFADGEIADPIAFRDSQPEEARWRYTASLNAALMLSRVGIRIEEVHRVAFRKDVANQMILDIKIGENTTRPFAITTVIPDKVGIPQIPFPEFKKHVGQRHWYPPVV